MDISQLQVGKTYQIAFTDKDRPSSSYHGRGLLKEINPPEYNQGSFLFDLIDTDGEEGVFEAAYIVAEIETEPPVLDMIREAIQGWSDKELSAESALIAIHSYLEALKPPTEADIKLAEDLSHD